MLSPDRLSGTAARLPRRRLPRLHCLARCLPACTQSTSTKDVSLIVGQASCGPVVPYTHMKDCDLQIRRDVPDWSVTDPPLLLNAGLGLVRVAYRCPSVTRRGGLATVW